MAHCKAHHPKSMHWGVLEGGEANLISNSNAANTTNTTMRHVGHAEHMTSVMQMEGVTAEELSMEPEPGAPLQWGLPPSAARKVARHVAKWRGQHWCGIQIFNTMMFILCSIVL